MGVTTNTYKMKVRIEQVRSVTSVLNTIANDLLHNDISGIIAAIGNILRNLSLPRAIAAHPIPRVTFVRSFLCVPDP